MGDICRLIPELKDGVEWITDSGVETLVERCKKLTRLDLSYTKITHRTLEAIA